MHVFCVKLSQYIKLYRHTANDLHYKVGGLRALTALSCGSALMF